MGKSVISTITSQSLEFLETFEKNNDNYDELFRKKEQLEEELRKRLDEEAAARFEEYANAAEHLELMCTDEAFSEGIRFGIKLMHEALD